MVDYEWWIRGLVLFQTFEIVCCEQGAHLGDSDFIELKQALGLGNTLADENGIEALEICEDDKLLKRSMVADVTFGIGMGIAPCTGCLSEEGDIEQVGFVGIDERCLSLGECRGQECFFDGVGVDAVVDLGEGALEAPIELQAAVFILLKPLKFRDEIEFELGAEPRTELERDVFVSVCATVSTGTGNQPFGPCQVDPLFGRKEEAVSTGLISNSLEFGGIKMRVVDPLPDTQEQDRVFVL